MVSTALTGWVVAAVTLGCAFVVQAADDDRLKIVVSPRSNTASFIGSTDGQPLTPAVAGRNAQQIAADFLQERGHHFGITDVANQLRMDGVQTDELGFAHTTFRQVHRGIPVFSGIVKVHQNAAGQVTAANGRFYPISDKVNLQPGIDADTAERAAKSLFPEDETTAVKLELVIVDPGWYGDPPRGARLAWYVVLIDEELDVEDALFIDAQDATILDRWSLKCTIRHRIILNANGQSILPVTTPPAREEGQFPVASPEDVNRAYDYYGDTYDYYHRAFGRDSIDNAGMPMIATINWLLPGFCPNAFWSSALGQMVFCDGTITDDIVGHELTHGVTDFTSSLIYQNQSGQLNESLSDIFGELIDLFNGNAAFAGTPSGTPWPVHPTGPGLDVPNTVRTACSFAPNYPNGVRWLMGEDATIFGGAIRDMWNPTCHGDPDRANSTLNNCESFDNGGVHFGSGIPNHAFAIMTDGKSFNGQSVTGIGPIKAGAVWYRAQTTYFTPATDFLDAFAALNQAASDLVGTIPNDPRTGLPAASAFTPADAQEVEKALIAVEMNTDGRCGKSDDVLLPDPAPPCANKTILYSDAFETGAPGWSVSNSGPPTPYDWFLTSNLPFGRGGTAWYCENRNIGNCTTQNESAVHSLTSPIIPIPNSAQHIAIAFTHFLAAEPSVDGGNVKIRVNNGPWQLLPRSLYTLNPYNGRLRSAGQGNTNPLAGQDAWTGVGGQWGTSVFVDLSSTIHGGDSVQFRFDFGKDGCTGVTGWYLDDFELFTCGDCNGDGLPDSIQYRYSAASPTLQGIGMGANQQFVLATPPKAKSGTNVTFDLTAVADFDTDLMPAKTLTLRINSTTIATVYNAFTSPCNATPDRIRFTIPASTFNTAVGSGNATLHFLAPNSDPGFCGGTSYLTVFLTYESVLDDCNFNGIPDTTEILNNPSLDACVDGILDACQCDCNNNAIPDRCDLLNQIGRDCNQNGIIDDCEAPALVVHVGPDLFVSPGATTSLITASVQNFSGQLPLVYSWTVESGPAGGQFSAPTAASTTFTPQVAGSYVIRCTVSDANVDACSNFDELVITAMPLQAAPGTTYLACVGVTTPPLGSDPLAIGGKPPYFYTWSVLSGNIDLPVSQIHLQHPLMTPVELGDVIVKAEIADSSTPPQFASSTYTIQVGTAPSLDVGLYKTHHPIVTINTDFLPGGEITVSGGILPYSFAWNIVGPDINSYQLTNGDTQFPVIKPLLPGLYAITVSVKDASGCGAQAFFNLTCTENPPSSKSVTDDGGDGGNNGGSTTCGVVSCAPMSLTSLIGCVLGAGMLRRKRLRRLR